MERGNRGRLHPAALMAMLLASGHATPMPMPDGRPNRQQRRQARVSRHELRAPRSKFKPHQGKKECARRMKQMDRAALKAAA